jgi:hypothetical protein
MDVLRSCYSSGMLLSPDSNKITYGRWHFCEEGATAIPFQHAFGSRRWDDHKIERNWPVGEVVTGLWSRGTQLANMPGRRFCGSASVWANGAPVAQTGQLPIGPGGVPICCAPAPEPPPGPDPSESLIGGGSAGGSATETALALAEAEGGGLSGGSALTHVYARVTSCSACPGGAPYAYTLNVSGLGNNHCTDCAALNGSFDLANVGGCSWTSESFDFCGGSASWTLDVGGGLLTLRIEPGSIPAAVYALPSPWDCLSPVTLAVFNPDVFYCSWTGAILSLTVSPTTHATPVAKGGGSAGGSGLAVVTLAPSVRGGGSAGGSLTVNPPPTVSVRGGGSAGGSVAYPTLPFGGGSAGGSVATVP